MFPQRSMQGGAGFYNSAVSSSVFGKGEKRRRNKLLSRNFSCECQEFEKLVPQGHLDLMS